MSDLDDQLLAALLAEDAIGGTRIPQRSGTGPACLSFAQQRLWFLHRFDPDSTAYNLTRAYKLSGKLDREAFSQALHALIERHAILRTCFHEKDGEACQVVLDAPATQLEVKDLSDLSDSIRDETLARTLRETADCSFDLSAAPPLRIQLIRLGDREHVLVTSMHHILSDGQSNPVLARDLIAAYRTAIEEDRVSELPPLSIQYADFAVWQRNWLSGERLEQELSYWKRYLGEDLPALDLPTARPRSGNRTQTGSRTAFTLPQSIAQTLREFCQAQNCTPFVTLLAAWQLLLGRYSGQRNFAIGVPNAGRMQEELEELVGFFVNTQVYRAELSPETTVSSLCARLRDEARAGLDHASLPFELLLDHLNSSREPGRSPVFQTLFNLQVPSPIDLAFPGLSVEPIEVAETTAKFDLSLDVFYPEAGRNDVPRCEIEYSTELFDAADIERMARHFQQLLKAMMAAPDSRIDALQMLEHEERLITLDSWNHTSAPVKTDEDMLSLFEQRVQASPDSIAAIFGSTVLTYRDLNSRANQLGRWLTSQGVSQDMLVGVCLPRDTDLLVALLAIQKAGGGYLPIDPEQPALRNEYILKHADPALVLTTIETQESVGGTKAVICLEQIIDELARLPDHNVECAYHPHQLAYTLYTSGSTGTPKGVQVDRLAFVNFLHAMQRQIRITPDDRLLAVTTLGFDIAGLELFLPLISGARTIVADRNQAHDPNALLDLMNNNSVTLMQATPATWQMLVEQVNANEALADTPARRWTDLQVLCGGEALSAELASQLLARGVRLLNVYGPTETTVWSAAWQVEHVDSPIVPIGHPIANNRLHILDATLEPVPPGVIGELYIGGVGLARGYSQQPDLTAEAFVPNPFQVPDAPGSATGSRLYRTGDLARRRDDGTIEFVGRRDHQLKIRGFRVETGEIEAALEYHPAVRQAVVTAHRPTGKDSILCAHLVTDPSLLSESETGGDTAITPAALTTYLRERLPGYMIPAALIPMERLPLNANGKVDRKALPAPDLAKSSRSEAPLSDTEVRLAKIWEEVLDVSKVGLDEDFFMLGGHSLHLVRIQVRIRAEFDSDIPLGDLFVAPVLRDMAARVEESLERNSDDDMAFMAELLETL